MDIRKWSFTLALAVIALAAASLHAQPGPPTVTHMGNGLTVIILEDHAAPVVGVDVWVGAGSANETAKTSGISHFIEHLLFGATLTRQPGDMDLEMESLGATLDARTSRDWAHFSTTVSSRYLSKAIDVLSDAVINAQFRQPDVEQERLVLLEELAKKQTDPIKVCKDYLAAEIYGTHPYGLPVEGTAETVRDITRDEIAAYHDKYYVAKNIAVVLVGDVDPQPAVSEIGKSFQKLSSKPAPDTTVAPVKPVESQVRKSIKLPYRIDFVAIGFLGPVGKDYQDVCATDVTLTYLGMGPHSWMSDELRDRMTLAEVTNADFLTQRGPGLISLIAGVKTANADKARDAILAKVTSVAKEGIPQAGLDLAKRSLLGQSAFQYETCAGLASAYGFYNLVSEPEFATKYLACVGSVTNEDVMRTASKYLDPNKAVVLTIGPDQGGDK